LRIYGTRYPKIGVPKTCYATKTFILKGLRFELYCMSEIHRYRVDGLVKIFPKEKPGLNIIFDLMSSGENIGLIEFLFSDVAKRWIQLTFSFSGGRWAFKSFQFYISSSLSSPSFLYYPLYFLVHWLFLC